MSKLTKKRTIIIACLLMATLLLILALVFQFKKEPKEYEVIFYSDNEKVLSVSKITHGQMATPPVAPQLSNGLIFQKWDKELLNVRENMQIHPCYTAVSESENAITLPGTYGVCGTTVSIPLKLCGKVCLSGVDLTVEYDSDVLRLNGIEDEDQAIIYNSENPGVVRLNYVSLENTTAEVDFCNLSFSIIKEVSETPIRLKVNSICANGEENAFYTPSYRLVDATLYILPDEGGAGK